MCLLIHGLLLHLFMEILILKMLNLNLFSYYFRQDHSFPHFTRKCTSFTLLGIKKKNGTPTFLEVLNLYVCG